MNRRKFLRTSTAAAAGTAAFPMILTSCSQVKGANDRVVFGHIGLGGRGTHELKSYFLPWTDEIRSVAFCDVIEARRSTAAQLAQKQYEGKGISGDLQAYNEFERILERKDIDAVAITTPDHWHLPIAIKAAEAGKHIHLAKPLGLSYPNFQALKKAIRKNRVTFNYGTQQRSFPFIQKAMQFIQDGKIGTVERVEVWCPRINPVPNPVCQLEPIPEGLDWNRYLGPAPFHPYCPERANMQSSYFLYDFSLGFIAGWGAHPLDMMVMGIKDQMTGRLTAKGTGGFWEPGGLWDTINSWDMTYQYENGLVMRFMSDEIAHPVIMEYRPRWESNGTTFYGSKGWISIGRNTACSDISSVHETLNIHANPEGWINEESGQLVRLFADSIQGKSDELCPLEDAILSDTLSHLGNIVIRTGQSVSWDPQRDVPIDNPEAMELFTRKQRQWNL